MEIVRREPRHKLRRIRLGREGIFRDIDCLTFKLAETVVAEPEARDKVASDSEDSLDGALITSFMDARAAQLRKRLAFCLECECTVSVDDGSDLEPDYEFRFRLPAAFKDSNLKVAAKKMHDYLVKGSVLDWYTQTGTGYGAALIGEVVELESQIVDIFRVPGFVSHPGLSFIHSYKLR